MSGSPITGDYIKAEGQAKRMGARLMAIVAKGDRERVYLAPTSTHEAVAQAALPTWRPEVTISGSNQYLGVRPYGVEQFDQLFTSRQLVALTAFSDLVTEARARVERDAIVAGLPDDSTPLRDGGTGAKAYAEAVGVYLAFAQSKAADRNTSLCVWEQKMDRLRGTFGRQALPMVWDYAETNPLSGTGGDIYGTAHSLCEVLDKYTTGGVLGSGAQTNAVQQSVEYQQGCLHRSALLRQHPLR